ncbi:MAG TPA: sigma 54-interacting transcriptional regulator [Kofleriaceae bacterium]|nr:sigma 54-interacting transcriptional regulator [Kofleriaceae bacterium]
MPQQVHTQLHTDVDSGLLVERSFRFRVVGGPDEGLTHVLDRGTTMVGTHTDNDVVLQDNTVSRYHLEIRTRREGIEIRDLDTTNGTKHGDVRIGQIVLAGSARLRLGKHTEVNIEPIDQSVDLGDWPHDHFGNAVGTAPKMRALFALLHRVALTDTTVLLLGETGTGKEALAEAIHRNSRRSEGPFIVVDCGSIPKELIGSELFGHVRGAFTGASSDKQGLIEASNHGTLFFDEIGELALDLQPQLLRVLDRRQVRRIGENRSIDVDIRVIAATHRDLRAMVRAGQFREDLYYRMAVVTAFVPPLRERKGDIPMLAQHFVQRMGRGALPLSDRLLGELTRHDWPGNVRELRNVVERAMSLGEAGLDDMQGQPGQGMPGISGLDDSLDVESTAPGSAPARHSDVLELPFKEAKAALVEAFERDYLQALLARHRGNISRAAAEAGIDRNYIHRLVKKYNLDVERS